MAIRGSTSVSVLCVGAIGHAGGFRSPAVIQTTVAITAITRTGAAARRDRGFMFLLPSYSRAASNDMLTPLRCGPDSFGLEYQKAAVDSGLGTACKTRMDSSRQ